MNGKSPRTDGKSPPADGSRQPMVVCLPMNKFRPPMVSPPADGKSASLASVGRPAGSSG